MRIRVEAGRHMRVECPVMIAVDKEGDLPRAFRSTATGKTLPCQVVREKDGRVILAFLVDFLPAGGIDMLEETDFEPRTGIELLRGDGKLDVMTDGTLITTYNFSATDPKPFYFPLIGPYNNQISRGYPMRDVFGEQKDHTHHRSMWTAHGDVNGVDFWSEQDNSGRQLHVAFPVIEGGPVLGRMSSLINWLDGSGEEVLLEQRDSVFYRTAQHLRIIDFKTSFFAINKDVRFGDTKEGGLISVRMASQICEEMGGKIENCYGGIGEAETWGRRAHWCNYSGPVSDDTVVGVAILDHPSNPRHPTYWHVRSYGLFAANPFGMSVFSADERIKGDMYLRAGTKVTFMYRIVLHLGYAWEANISNRYIDYVFPPRATLEG